MTRSRLVLTIEVVAAGGLLAYASTLPMAVGALGLLSLHTALTAVAFGLALLVLGFFNVWLPRGDAVDTTVAVAFASALVLGHPLVASAVVLMARCATVAIRPKGHTLHTVIELLARRTLLIAGVFVVISSFAPSILLNLGPKLAWRDLAAVAAAAVSFIVLDALIEQLHASIALRLPVLSLASGVVRLQGWMLAAEMSTAVLAVVMFPALQYWGLIVTVGLLLVMRQSFSLLLEVRASYTATVEVLARSIEAYDPARRGHGERVAGMAAHAGRLIGFQGKRLENLTYAALFHDVGQLGTDEASEWPIAESAKVLAPVGFLAGALPILHVIDTAGEDDASLDEEALIGAYLIARFSAIDTNLSQSMVEDPVLAARIGARLYAATRRNADRVVARVETELRTGALQASQLSEVRT